MPVIPSCRALHGHNGASAFGAAAPADKRARLERELCAMRAGMPGGPAPPATTTKAPPMAGATWGSGPSVPTRRVRAVSGRTSQTRPRAASAWRPMRWCWGCVGRRGPCNTTSVPASGCWLCQGTKLRSTASDRAGGRPMRRVTRARPNSGRRPLGVPSGPGGLFGAGCAGLAPRRSRERAVAALGPWSRAAQRRRIGCAAYWSQKGRGPTMSG